MNTPMQSKIKGKFDEMTGKAKQSIGEATHDQNMANRGAAQQVKGHAEQAWGAIGQAASERQNRSNARAEEKAHDIREKVTSTAQNVKEHIEASANPRNKPST